MRLQVTGHSQLLEGWCCKPKAEFATFAQVCDEFLSRLDPKFHSMLCTIMGNRGIEENVVSIVSGLPLSQPARRVWGFADSFSDVDSEIGALVLPLVQTLFVGIMRDLESACFVWDCMFLLGFDMLPHMCVSYLVCMRTMLTTALSPASSLGALERALNLSCCSIDSEALSRVIEKYVLPIVRSWGKNRLEQERTLRENVLYHGNKQQILSEHETACVGEVRRMRRNADADVMPFMRFSGAVPEEDQEVPLKVCALSGPVLVCVFV